MRRVFLDVGGHFGESLISAMSPRWRFDRIWSFEPVEECVTRLRPIADERVTVVPAGWWSSDTEMDVHEPGALNASVMLDWGRVERCRFIDAAGWMAAHISDDDQVWLKMNIESAEVEVLTRLLESGEIAKIDHLVVHFDGHWLGLEDSEVPVRAALDASGIEWREAQEVMFGRTDTIKCDTWLAWTAGNRLEFQRRKWEHLARRSVYRARQRMRALRSAR